MTFCIGVGTFHVGLVAADTRITRFEDGREIHYDIEGIVAKDALEGPDVPIGSVFRKLKPLPDGSWVTGAGTQQWLMAVTPRALEAPVDEFNAFRNRVLTASDKVLKALEHLPETRKRTEESSHLILVKRGIGRFFCSYVNAKGEGDADAGIFFCPPPETDLVTFDALADRYQAQFTDDKYATGFYGMIRETAALFCSVYDQCGPVGGMSDLLEIGVSRRGRSSRFLSQHLPPTRCLTVMGATDNELQRMFLEVRV